MKVYLSDWDEYYPVCEINEDPENTYMLTEVDVPEETLARWKDANRLFDQAQNEMLAAINAAKSEE